MARKKLTEAKRMMQAPELRLKKYETKRPLMQKNADIRVERSIMKWRCLLKI